jgi:hypothetical protein
LLQGVLRGSAQFPLDDFLRGRDFSAAKITDPDVFAGQGAVKESARGWIFLELKEA